MSPAAADQMNAYNTHQRNDETPRETEARALINCANRLEAATNPDLSFEEYGDALRFNQRLWTIFQVAVCQPDNALPRELKQIILNLGNYVEKVSMRAMPERNPELLSSLVSINRIIAVGLVKNPAASSEAAHLPPPAAGEEHASLMTSA